MEALPLLPYFQLGVAIFLITAILLQGKGTGLSAVFGGEGLFYRSKRGFEKWLFRLTIFLSVLFLFLTFLAFIQAE